MSPQLDQTQDAILAEDYCTCLAEKASPIEPAAQAAAEQIYIGHLEAGVDVFDLSRKQVALASNAPFTKVILSAGQTYLGISDDRKHGPAHHPNQNGVLVLDDATVASVNLTTDIQPAHFPSGAPPSILTELPPSVALRNLKDLYAAGRFGAVLARCARAEHDQRYSDRQPQILYIRFAAERNLGDAVGSARLRDLFLERYPNDALAAYMYFDQGISLLAEGNYQRARDRFTAIDERFPNSGVAERAKEFEMHLVEIN
jgi:hypothetical protein